MIDHNDIILITLKSEISVIYIKKSD